MALILFVSDNYIKQYTPIGSLVEWSELEPSIISAQDSFIQDLLGTNFYNHLQDAYQNQTLTNDEIELVGRIKPALAHKGADQALPFLSFQIKNKGIMTQRGDYSDSSDLSILKYLRNELSNRAEFYSIRLTNWLCENRTLFPQYTVDNSTDMKPKSGKYDGCDLYLD